MLAVLNLLKLPSNAVLLLTYAEANTGTMHTAKKLNSGIKAISVEERKICVDCTDPYLVPEITIDWIGAKHFLAGEHLNFTSIRFEMNLLFSYQSSYEEALSDWPHWRNSQPFKCTLCDSFKFLPVKITRVQRLVVYTEIPRYKEVVGWKVSGAECEAAKCSLIDWTMAKRIPIYEWDYVTQGKTIVCEPCAQRIRESGKEGKLSECIIVDLKS